jgi:hypothetical protein
MKDLRCLIGEILRSGTPLPNLKPPLRLHLTNRTPMSAQTRPTTAFPDPEPDDYYAAGSVFQLRSHESGPVMLTVLWQFAVGKRVPQILFCGVESPDLGYRELMVYFFDPRFVRKGWLIRIGISSVIIPYISKYPETAFTPGGVSYRVDRKAFFNLPFETKPQHCQRIFEDFLLASQRLAHSECLPPQGSCNMECTGYVAGDPSWTLTMPVLFLGASNPPGSLPSPITHNLLRPLAPDKLELFKTKILDLVEQAARNEVYISDLRLEHFGYLHSTREWYSCDNGPRGFLQGIFEAG